MYFTEKLASSITYKISSNLDVDKDKEEIIHYGAIMLIQTITSILATIISGLTFKLLIEILVISFTSSLLRKNSGGAHASSPGRCIIIGTTIFTILSLVIKPIIKININILIISTIITFIFSYYIVIKKCPVAAPTKPIRSIEKRKKLKRKTINTLHAYFITCCALSYFYFSLNNLLLLKLIICVVMGVFWQMVTLTTIGGNAMHTIDNFLYIFTKERGEVK